METDIVGTDQELFRWVAVATYRDWASASVAKQALDAEDIPSYIEKPRSGATLRRLLPGMGGIKLLVPDDHVEIAREILDRTSSDGEQSAPETDADLSSDELGEDEIHAHACPKCFSTDSAPIGWGFRAMQSLVILFLAGSLAVVHLWLMLGLVGFAIYFLLTKPALRCTRCAHRW